MKYSFLLTTIIFISFTTAFAQKEHTDADKDSSYTRVITQRAEKIVSPLGIPDTKKAARVQNIIIGQYRHLNEIYAERDAQKKALKADTTQSKDVVSAGLLKIDESTTNKIDLLHKEYIKALAKELNEEQIDKVKDGMTYGVLEVTYNAYLDMLPDLTTQQKAQIMTWLVEAREHAMDGESSEKKHAWFGK